MLYKVLIRFNPFEENMKTKNKLPFIAFILILGLGCFMQIYSICELFFSYPTVTLSEANFDVSAIPFPSMTFCTYIGNTTIEMSSKQVFKTFNASEIVGYIQTW